MAIGRVANVKDDSRSKILRLAVEAIDAGGEAQIQHKLRGKRPPRVAIDGNRALRELVGQSAKIGVVPISRILRMTPAAAMD